MNVEGETKQDGEEEAPTSIYRSDERVDARTRTESGGEKPFQGLKTANNP